MSACRKQGRTQLILVGQVPYTSVYRRSTSLRKVAADHVWVGVFTVCLFGKCTCKKTKSEYKSVTRRSGWSCTQDLADHVLRTWLIMYSGLHKQEHVNVRNWEQKTSCRSLGNLFFVFLEFGVLDPGEKPPLFWACTLHYYSGDCRWKRGVALHLPTTCQAMMSSWLYTSAVPVI